MSSESDQDVLWDSNLEIEARRWIQQVLEEMDIVELMEQIPPRYTPVEDQASPHQQQSSSPQQQLSSPQQQSSNPQQQSSNPRSPQQQSPDSTQHAEPLNSSTPESMDEEEVLQRWVEDFLADESDGDFDIQTPSTPKKSRKRRKRCLNFLSKSLPRRRLQLTEEEDSSEDEDKDKDKRKK